MEVAHKERRWGAQTKPFVGAKVELYKAKKEVLMESKGKSNTQPTRNHDIKYFRCLGVRNIASQCSNKRVMILNDHGKIKSKNDRSKEDKMPPFEDYSYENVEYLVEGEYLVIRHTLNIYIKEDNVEQ